MSLQEEIEAKFSTQIAEWEQLRRSIQQLKMLKEKHLEWGHEFKMKIQFNPARIVSTSAKIDKENIEKRACFLCEENRPAEQTGINFLDKYIILCNPFPILENHLTIPLHSHVPQLIRNKIPDMLNLAEQLPDYIVFYNGPKSGASAPDHFHFQAGLKTAELLQGDNELRTCMTIESESREEVIELFEEVYQFLRYLQPDEVEPMMNIITFLEENRYIVNMYPRKKHRPSQYFEEGVKQLVISPGALDMAGLLTCVREEDFNKIDKQDIENIYSQVSLAVI